MMHHEDAMLMLPELLLGSLGDEDAAAVRAHADGCERCQRELAELDRTFGALTSLLPAAEPSPALRARVLDAVDEALETQDAAAVADPVVVPVGAHAGPVGMEPANAGANAGSRTDAGAGSAQPARPAGPARARAQRRWGTNLGWAPALAAAACLALLVVSASLIDRTSDLERSLDRANGQIAAMTGREQEQAATIRASTLLADEAIPLQTTRGMAGSHGHLLKTSAGGTAMLTLQNLPAPREGRSWQVWAIDGSGQKRSIDVVSRGSSYVVVLVQLGEGPGRVATVAITSEPRGGSVQPTGVPVAHASV